MLLTYYGDDFSGSTDVLEAVSVRGIPAVLFLEPPTAEDLTRFPDCQVIGVAGLSRSQSPQWMDQNLPPVFEALRALGAPLCHYKLCSTFDSSPAHGSIGRAVEIGRQVFGMSCVPAIVGAPVLRRYVLFGNLFATVSGETYRIDRHPTMSRHPVTPMSEGDLRRHFAGQSPLSTAIIDILSLQAGAGPERWEQLKRDGAEVIFFDTLDTPSLREAGRTVWETRGSQPSFIAGSSGVEYALLAWWDAQGLLPPQPAIVNPGPVDRLLVISGSCSPVTAAQIQWALNDGFVGIPADAAALAAGGGEYRRVLAAAGKVLSDGASPIVYSAAGPMDIVHNSAEDRDFGTQLGAQLGALAGELVRGHDLRRILIAGGDTSGHASQALSIQALTMIRPFAPGSPLCRIWSNDSRVDGREILLKGGQVGGVGLFGDVRAGI